MNSNTKVTHKLLMSEKLKNETEGDDDEDDGGFNNNGDDDDKDDDGGDVEIDYDDDNGDNDDDGDSGDDDSNRIDGVTVNGDVSNIKHLLGET